MSNVFQDAQAALEQSTEMVPTGQFNKEETERRRELWQLWVLLPAATRHQPIYPEILAKTFGQPIEWVNEVLNLDTEAALN